MHMDTWLAGGDHYWKTIQDFFEQHVPENRGVQSSRHHNGKKFSKSYYGKHPAHPQPFLQKPDSFVLASKGFLLREDQIL